MRGWKTFLARYGWAAVLAAALLFVATDTAAHTRKTRWISGIGGAQGLVPDPASPTGYADGQREVILPYTGLDGLHWVMHTQQMLADGGLRVREVAYDNAPEGREAHWSSLPRWWLAALAWLDHVFTDTPLPLAVEEVIPFSTTLLQMLIIAGLVPVMARRFGTGLAALLAVSLVAVGPFYESYTAGRGDHHGLAAMNALLTLLFLIAGGAGWVRANATDSAMDAQPRDAAEGESDDATDQALLAWVPERAQARRWFIASGVAGGIGLWVSAASQIPVLCEIALGALLAGALGGNVRAASVARPDPSLWRVWGLAGAATSLLLYLLEYFPAHFGMRLEVNHPFYAFAWAGAGELLYRGCLCMNGGSLASKPRDWAALAAAGAALLLPLGAVLFFPAKTFWIADPFLWAFHNDYIVEFFPLWTYLKSQTLWVLVIMANPLVLLAGVMFAWSWRRGRMLVLWALLPAWALFALFLWMSSDLPRWRNFWLLCLAAAAAGVVFLGVWSRWPRFPRPARALMLLALPACVVSYALALWQVRWVEVSYALWIPALIAAGQSCRLHPNFRWTWTRQLAAGALLAWALLPLPAFMLWSWARHGWVAPPSREEHLAILTRDVARELRARAGNGEVVVLSDPTTTTWLVYYGGFKGLGTFYWENLAGLKASSDIIAAKGEDAALPLLRKHNVRFLVFPSWSLNPKEFALVANGLAPGDPPPRDAFALRMLTKPAFPRWTRPVILPGPPPRDDHTPFFTVLEVVPDQTVEEACVRFAEWMLHNGNRAGALANLNAALQNHRDYLPALVLGARLQHSSRDAAGFTETVRRIRAQLPQAGKLPLEHRVDLAMVLGLTGDSQGARAQLLLCFDDISPQSLAELRPDALYNFVTMARMSGLLDDWPGLQAYALPRLPNDLRARFLNETAARTQPAATSAQIAP